MPLTAAFSRSACAIVFPPPWTINAERCGATCARKGNAFDGFRYCPAQCAAGRRQARSTHDRHRREGRPHRCHRTAARQREGRGAGPRPAGLLGLRRDPHPSRQVVHPRALRAHDQAQPAPRDGARVGGEAHLHGRGRDRARLGHDREVHRPRRDAHAHPCRSRSQGRPARLRRREGADRQVQMGDRPRDLRHAAGGPDQQSRHRRADDRGFEERRNGGWRCAQLRQR